MNQNLWVKLILKMKKQTITIIITLILLLITVGYIVDDKIIKPHYQEQGAIAMRNQIALSQTQTGNILIVNQNNLTIRNIQEICQSK